MNPDSYHLKAYWGDRPETDGECGARCAQMMTRLAAIDPVFGQWCKQAMSRAAANKPFCSMPPQVAELARKFDKNRRYQGHPKLKEQPYRSGPKWG